ncbi:helix-turn-helix domain-containing protein [Phormidium sp. FACHB-592]|uniref:Helix-turn-helix domain-containing protein n=1 Tax=Stenomitos frigidus AS-A4 TaxID=2933935 RepID=A0ABV0KE78_9CYAN|nr:helix-turn-helix domain-containing protein [Phormidium sp. FACHB-592]MBD2076147.1 helix-turn-helix domain-containing protein [Phormidium sp. FACHB-592]
MTQQFKQVAIVIAERLAQLLAANVSVLNEQGTVVAMSNPHAESALHAKHEAIDAPVLSIPIHFDGQMGEVLIVRSAQSEAISLRPAQVLVELLLSQATATRPDQHELKNKFIHDLLRGSNASEVNLLREGQILGMDLTRPRAVLLIDAADYILSTIALRELEPSAQILRRAQLVISSVVSFFHLPNDTICAYIGDGEIAVLKASSTQDLAAWTNGEDEPRHVDASWANLIALKRAGAALLDRLRGDTRTTINIGIGRYHPTLKGLASSYQDARAALSLGKRFSGQNQVHCLDGLGIAAFVGLSHERTKIDLARYLLSPLDQESELLETLDVFFFENCCLSTTASRLSIHRNTLSYRLEKITLLTGLDPRRFDAAMQIRLALFLRSLHGDGNKLCKCTVDEHWDQPHIGQISDESCHAAIHYR